MLAAPGDISTMAGGVGQGSALSVAQVPAGIAVAGPFVYEADSLNHVVRRVDTATGSEIVVAGTGSWGFSGDGGAATSAQLNYPYGVAIDTAGNVFIADIDTNRIRKVDPAGTITTVAGTGWRGFSGDGGPATSAQLSAPSGVAVDTAGTLFIADVGNNRVRTVDTAGTITTVAGTGGGFSGDGGPATSAQLSVPSGVAVDLAGNLFIADTGNNRIRKVDPAGTITTVAGTGAAGFSGDGGRAKKAQLNAPSGVAVDLAGNLFIADTGNNRIRKVDPAGTITTVAGTGAAGFSGDGGRAKKAQLNAPSGVAVDTAGTLFIADVGNNRIRAVDTAGTITTIGGTGDDTFSGDGKPASSAQLYNPNGVVVDSAGTLFIADVGNNRIRAVDTTATITTVAGTGADGFSGDGGAATSAQLSVGWVYPSGAAVDPAGELFIADVVNNRIRTVDTAGRITTVAGSGFFGFSGDGGPATHAQLFYPSGVAVDPAGNLVVADVENHRIRRIDAAGTITTVAGTGAAGFGGDGGPATSAQLTYPSGVAVDPAGDLFIGDTSNNRIRKVDTVGTITTVAGTGTFGFGGDGGPATSAQLGGPFGVAVDPAGNLFIADHDNNRIRKVDPAGTITTVAGTGAAGFSGDGGPATSAQLSAPSGVAVDPAGNLFIADAGNNRIRMVQALTPHPTAVATPPTPTPTPEDSGFVPPNANTAKCEAGVAKNVGTLLHCIGTCHIKAAAAAFKVKTFDEEACEKTDPAKSCRAKYDAKQAKLLAAGTCPACLDAAHQATLADQVETDLDSSNGALYCAGSAALGGDDMGFVPPDANILKCETRVAKNVGTLRHCIGTCHIKAAAAAFKVKTFDEEACEKTDPAKSCRAKYDAKQAKLLAAGTCPACLDAAHQATLADQVETGLDSNNGGIYCAGTTPLPSP
jgi:sugar lactone lactonase YvrE